jgi:hypothetical protein
MKKTNMTSGPWISAREMRGRSDLLPINTCRYILMKPLPAIEGSRRFLCSYVNSLDNLRKLSTEELLKGKQPVQKEQPGSHGRVEEVKSQPKVDIAWEKPRTGTVKLNVDGSFMEQAGGAGAGMILRDAEGRIVFSACRTLHHCGSGSEAELGRVCKAFPLLYRKPKLRSLLKRTVLCW